MQRPERRDILFNSADGKNAVAGYLYYSPTLPVRAVVQISHGMCEYISRYEAFAAYLTSKGIAMVGNDHIGHGTSAVRDEDLGYFTQKGGRRYTIRDLKTMNRLARDQFPGVPLVLLGHSMGSFFARRYAVDYPDSIDGLIIMGTSGPNPLAGFGVSLASLLARFRGSRYRSELMRMLAFNAYLRHVDDPKTPYDWISRDREIVDRYNADPLCTFCFTLNGFRELFGALRDVSSFHWAASLRRDLPVFVASGAADPVGNYGAGPRKVYKWLKDAKIRYLRFKLYPDMRHEILNEIDRETVYEDVLAFVERLLPTE